MARWFTATHNVTGEQVGPLAAADDQEIPGGYDPADWTFTLLDREPGEFDRPENGAVVLDVPKLDVALHARIDREAGAVRLRFITDVPGQDMTYKRKEEEARGYMRGEVGPFPTIEYEAEATDQTVGELAAAIISMADQWVYVGAVIEAARTGAKKAVTTAPTMEAKYAAAVVDWDAVLASIGI